MTEKRSVSRTMTILIAAVLATLSATVVAAQEPASTRLAATTQDQSTSSVAERLTEELRSLYGEDAFKRLQSAQNRNQVIDILKGFSRSGLAQELVKGVSKTRKPEEKLVLTTPPVGIDPCWLVCLNCIGVHCEPPPGCGSLTAR